MRTYTRGQIVLFRDENDRLVRGRILGYGQANDGTGRYGWNVETLDRRMIYWRHTVRRQAGTETHA
jgi:hypothetical protein